MNTNDFSIGLPSYLQISVEQVLGCLRENKYCALIGPRYAGKSDVMREVKRILQEDIGLMPVYVDLAEVDASRQTVFFTALYKSVAQPFRAAGFLGASLDTNSISKGFIFTERVDQLLRDTTRRMVLLIDHLEAVPNDLLHVLLASLRKLYQQVDPRVLVVTAGALSLASATQGEISPFRNIARSVVVDNFDTTESEKLVDDLLGTADINISSNARGALIAAGLGDSMLINILCTRLIASAQQPPIRMVSRALVRKIVDDFLERDALEYSPLQEGLRVIEDDFHLLMAVLKILEIGSVPRNQLQLEFSPDLDTLYLTGLIRKASNATQYQARNEIIRRFLIRYLHTGKVGQLLVSMGRWEHALRHFAASIQQGDRTYHHEFLTASINAMYAANNLSETAFYLAQGLHVAFGLDEIQVWNLSEEGEQAQLDLIHSPYGMPLEELILSKSIPMQDDRLEVNAYKENRPLQGREEGSCVRRAFPLVPINNPIGVVTFCQSQLGVSNLNERRTREIQLIGYLHQSARALDETRARQKHQAILHQQDDELKHKTKLLDLINRVGNLSLTIGEIDKVFHLILTCITANFGLGFNRVWLFLATERSDRLVGKMAIGDFLLEKAYLTWERVAALTFDEYVKQLLQGYIEYSEIDSQVRGVELLLDPTTQDPINNSFNQRTITHLNSQPELRGTSLGEFMQKFDVQTALVIPLQAQEKSLGVLIVDNRFNFHFPTKLEEEMLVTLANLAAAADLNARLQMEEKKRRQLAEAMGQAALLVAEPLELREVLARALDQMTGILPFRSASIQLYDKDLQILRIEAGAGFANPLRINGKEFPLDRKKYPNVTVFQDRRAYTFENIQEHFPHFSKPEFGVTEIKGWLGVPLIAGEQALGVITLDSPDLDAYNEEHVVIAQRFAGNVSLLIRNAILLKDEKDRSVRLEALRQSSEEVTRLLGRPLKEVLAKIAMNLCKVISADCAIIYPYQAEQKVYDVRNIGAHNLLVEKKFSFKTRQDVGSMLSVVLQSDEPVVVENIETNQDRSGRLDIWTDPDSFLMRESIKSFIGYKLQMDDSLVGTMFVNFRRVHKFNNIEVETVKIFASQAALAIQQTRSMEIARKDHLTLQAAQSITTTVGYENRVVLETFMKQAANVVGAEKGRLLLTTEDGLREISSLAIDGEDRKSISDHATGPCQLLTMALRSHESILIVDSSLEPVPECCSNIFANYRSMLITPIFNHGRTRAIGILLLANKIPSAFTQVDQQLMDDLSSFVTIVIQSNEGIHDTQTHVKLQESLLQASKGMVSIQELRKTLKQIAELVWKTLNCDVVSLYPYKPSLDNFELPYTAGDIYDIKSIMALNQVSKKSVIWRLMEKGSLERTEQARHSIDFNARFSKVDRRRGVKSFVEREQIQSVASIPLIMGRERLGILFINYRTAHHFTENEIKAIELFAELTSIAIHNSRLYDTQFTNRAHLEAIYEASKIVTASVGMDQQHIMSGILEQAIDSISGKTGPKASFGTFHRFDLKGNTLKLEGVYPPEVAGRLNLKKIDVLSLEEKRGRRKPRGIIVRAALAGEGILVPNAPSDPDYLECNPRTRSELAVPIKNHVGELIGVLDIESDQPDGLDENDKEALLKLADLAKIALQNSETGEKMARTSTIAVMAAWGAEKTHEINRSVQGIQLAIGELLAHPSLTEEEKGIIGQIQDHANYLAMPVFPLPLGDPSQQDLEGFESVYNSSCPDAIIHREITTLMGTESWLRWKMNLQCQDVQVKMHEQWIRIILNHLVKNALRYIDHTKRKRIITISTWQEDNWLKIDVTDTGTGISEVTQKKLFRGQISGTGTLVGRGLLLVHFLMEQHGGTVELYRTKLDVGSTFRLKFPVLRIKEN